ncbi:hypothetical protein GF402_11340 [Candidatus Fermentibacteria bacterium]|nr:hypothetical protein [Candidatus Fermentibacteria bacterium]
MIPFLYFALADTVIVEPPDEMVSVHEWGVIELDESQAGAVGVPDGYVDAEQYYHQGEEMQVRAPVVWFHGAECSGIFSVELRNGCFDELMPNPDSIAHLAIPGVEGSDVVIAFWRDLKLVEEQIPIDGMQGASLDGGPFQLDCFTYAVPMWRDVPAHYVLHPGGQYQDRFIYYESSMSLPSALSGEYYNCQGEALVFFADDDKLACVRGDPAAEMDLDGYRLANEDVLSTLCDWGDNQLESEEVLALWRTWRPVLRTRCELEGETVILFPLTPEQEDVVSKIEFVPDEDWVDVRYERLLLGLGTVNL